MRLRRFFRAAEAIKLFPEERKTMEMRILQHVRNMPVRMEAPFRHPSRTMGYLVSFFAARNFRSAQSVRLHKEERDHMRKALIAHMHAVPVVRNVIDEVPNLHPYRLSFRTLIPVTATVLLSVGSISYAAEGAMPYDFLYPVKILVLEPLRDSFSFSAEAKARNGVYRVVQRLDEAVTLASENRLDRDRSALLREHFIAQADQASERIRSLLRRGLDDAALEVLTTFEASLGAYGMTLTDLGGEEAGSADIMQELLQTVSEEERRVAAAGNAVVVDLVAQGRSVNGAVHAASRATEVHLKHMQVTAGETPKFQTNTNSARIDASTHTAKSHLHEADARLNAGEEPKALEAAKESLRYAEAADLLLDIEQDKVGRSRSLPDWNINFVPGTRRELRERTEIRQERERLLQEKELKENAAFSH